MTETVENWKWVPEHEGKYAVSDFGRVYSYVSGRYLRPVSFDKEGHVKVSLGRADRRSVHSIVMQTFVGERPKGADIRHLNGVPDDNRLENLEYASRSTNMKDIKKHGGRKSGFGLLTALDIKLDALTTGDTQEVIAKRHGVHQTTVSRCIAEGL